MHWNFGIFFLGPFQIFADSHIFLYFLLQVIAVETHLSETRNYQK